MGFILFRLWVALVFGFAFAAASASASEKGPDCIRLLQEARHPDWSGIDLDTARWIIRQAVSGRFGPDSNSTPLSFLHSAVRRRHPHLAREIEAKIVSGRSLSPTEAYALDDAVIRDLREALFETQLKIHEKVRAWFTEYAVPRLKRPVNRVDRVWRALGFRVENGRLITPNYEEMARNLDRYQEGRGIPKEKRLIFSRVYRSGDGGPPVYHSGHLPLAEGKDLPRPEDVSSNEVYVDALERNVVIVERDLHDVGHLVGWVAFPEIFAEVRKLGRIHLENPEDYALMLRFYWASEYFAFVDRARVRRAIRHFVSKNAWEEPGIGVGERFARVKAEVDRLDESALRKRIETTLLPGYDEFFVPVGGAQAQYGEMEGFPGRGKEKSAVVIRKRYHSDTANQNRPIDNVWVVHEHPRMFEFHLREVLETESKERLARLRDLVARTEFALGELAELDPLETIRLFSKEAPERESSRFAEILRVLHGEGSLLYRILVDRIQSR